MTPTKSPPPPPANHTIHGYVSQVWPILCLLQLLQHPYMYCSGHCYAVAKTKRHKHASRVPQKNLRHELTNIVHVI